VTVKQGEKLEAWQLDGITGATITSEAIGEILNDSAGAWVPVLEKNSNAFVTSAAPGEE
jgi:electron transport complex protein RnfG